MLACSEPARTRPLPTAPEASWSLPEPSGFHLAISNKPSTASPQENPRQVAYLPPTRLRTRPVSCNPSFARDTSIADRFHVSENIFSPEMCSIMRRSYPQDPLPATPRVE
jgi:hypothetical protein